MNPHYHSYYHVKHHHPAPPHGGLLGIFGGIVGLTTATLQSGARIIRTVVEGTLWHRTHPVYTGCGCPCHHGYHCHHVDCCPPQYPCGCCG
ncbi:MAG: hypothetical protein Kow0042_29000 [Calditrichia bacterium]